MRPGTWSRRSRSLGHRCWTGTLVIDLEATIAVCHSERALAAASLKHTFGYHPLLAFCDNTGEVLSGCSGRVTPGVTPPPTT
jgi:hypothetical protein